jgi:hypothetical protein
MYSRPSGLFAMNVETLMQIITPLKISGQGEFFLALPLDFYRVRAHFAAILPLDYE